jgi:hypothetical protein
MPVDRLMSDVSLAALPVLRSPGHTIEAPRASKRTVNPASLTESGRGRDSRHHDLTPNEQAGRATADLATLRAKSAPNGPPVRRAVVCAAVPDRGRR